MFLVRDDFERWHFGNYVVGLTSSKKQYPPLPLPLCSTHQLRHSLFFLAQTLLKTYSMIFQQLLSVFHQVNPTTKKWGAKWRKKCPGEVRIEGGSQQNCSMAAGFQKGLNLAVNSLCWKRCLCPLTLGVHLINPKGCGKLEEAISIMHVTAQCIWTRSCPVNVPDYFRSLQRLWLHWPHTSETPQTLHLLFNK